MKKHSTFKLLASLLIAGFVILLAVRATAQTFVTLHCFTASTGSYPNITNNEGAYPEAGLILSGNALFGTTTYGGPTGNGTVFAVNTDGTGFTNLHYFTNIDGANPTARVTLCGEILYGTTTMGGGSGYGTIFRANTNGSGFTNLHVFTDTSDGAYPHAGLFLSGTNLYGTTEIGGNVANGSVYMVSTDGLVFTNLHRFIGTINGELPFGPVILSGNTLYGTSRGDFISSDGTVFAVNTDGTGFTNFQNFIYSNGALPWAGLILSGNNLYGTTALGGDSGSGGTVFSINSDGTGFTNIYNFTGGSDGSGSEGDLILKGRTLYGATLHGGYSQNGTVFAVNTDGTGFTTLYQFIGGSDGANPNGGLVLIGNTLYGTAQNGGIYGNGTIFSLTFVPQLSITPSETNVILTWPTNVAGFDYSGYTLQCASDLVSSGWTNASPAPVVVSGQFTVTNPISAAQMFYRLSQ